MKKQVNVLPPNSYHNSISEFKDNELAEMLVTEFRTLLLKMIRDLKEDSNKQINKVKKPIQDLDKKVSTMEEKFNKEMEIMKKNQVQMLEIKASINQTQTKWIVLLTDKIKQKKEYQRWGSRLRSYCRQTIIKKKINIHEYNIQEFWDTIKRSNLRIRGMEEGAEIQTNVIENLFSEIIAENSSNLCNSVDILNSR
jgi:hypothetical protein